MQFGDYRTCPGVRPLGSRAGLPRTAAVVDAAAELRDFDPVLAEQCESPEALFLPDNRLPKAARRRCVIVDKTYDKFIDTAERIGLIELLPEEQLPRSWGQPH